MNTDQRRQLTELADGLLQVPPHKFDMTQWGKGHLDVTSETFDCGFAGCAIGWAPKLVRGWSLGFMSGSTIPMHDQQYEFGAVASYLGISIMASMHLFSPASYHEGVTPTEVANQIHQYLKEHP